VEDYIWNLLARQFTGEATPAELQELDRLLAEDPALRHAAEQLRNAWQHPGKSDMQKALSSFAKIDARIRQQEASVGDVHQLPQPGMLERYRFVFTAAACMLLLAGAWFLFFNNKSVAPKALAMQEITTPAKTIRNIQLPDGSSIWLNEGSRIDYSEAFNDKIREVWLRGEAFFDVAKNKQKPFIIHAGRVNVKVLGTAFNIKSYPGEKNVETSLIRGSVEVTVNDDPSKIFILTPNQKILVPAAGDTSIDSSSVASPAAKEIRYKPLTKVAGRGLDTVIAETSWVDGKLAFYELSFKELALQLERRYNVSFVFKDPRKENLVFTGVFYQQTLPEALHALSLTGQFKYRVQDSTVYILK
jgi:ferric-dicitrate binding protein FerR (iron transport regulator)